MTRQTRRREHHIFDEGPRGRDRPDEMAVAVRIAAKIDRGLGNRSAHDRGGRTVIERMDQHRRRFNPCQSMLVERQRSEERRSHRHGVHGRADVMHEARQRERFGSAPTADRRLGFVHDDLQARACERDCGRKPVRTRADDNGIWMGHVFAITLFSVALRSAAARCSSTRAAARGSEST